MLLAKLLLLLSTIAPDVGYFEHNDPSRMVFYLTDEQMDAFLEKQSTDEQIKRSMDSYVESHIRESDENLHRVVINFHKITNNIQESKEEAKFADNVQDDPEFTTEEYVD
jgi:hypothetical protein